MKLTRHSASATLDMQRDGVLVVTLAGPLTGAALNYFKAGVVEAHGPAIRSFVADYRRATLALGDAELDAVLEGEAPDAGPGLPAAMVVRPNLTQLFVGHCMRMAPRGIVRRAFNVMPPALTWAARHAQMQALTQARSPKTRT